MTDKKPLGSITTVLRKARQGFEQSGKVNVPCGSCNACCRSPKLFVTLFAEELEQFPDAEPFPEGQSRGMGWALPKNADGSCTRLIDGKCSIYDKRPISCKGYDCRYRNFLGIMEANDPPMREAFEQWSAPSSSLVEDQITIMALRRAACGEDGHLAVNQHVDQICILAIANYKQFLEPARKVLALIKSLPQEVQHALRQKAVGIVERQNEEVMKALDNSKQQ